MEIKKKLLILFVKLWLIISITAAPSPQNDQDFEKGEAEMTKFHVNSKIQLRYAITDVETEIRNRHTTAKEVRRTPRAAAGVGGAVGSKMV